MPTLNPNRKPGRASIVQLDFDVSTAPRKEHSILYFNPNWDELEDFLADPIGMLKLYAKLFPGSTVPWTLKGPVTARIEPISAFGADPSGNASIDRFASLANIPSGSEKLVGRFAAVNDLSQGAFLLEFAPHTRSIIIAYIPPRLKIDQFENSRGTPNAKPSGGRFTGTITKSTLCYVAESETATLHFDIGRSPRERAQFIVDHLENPILTCRLLNDAFAEEGAIADSPLLEEGSDPLPTITPTKVLPRTFKVRSGDVMRRLPSMFIEDIDNTGAPYVCGIVPVGSYDPNDPVDPDPLYLGNIILKDYPPPSEPDPCDPTDPDCP